MSVDEHHVGFAIVFTIGSGVSFDVNYNGTALACALIAGAFTVYILMCMVMEHRKRRENR